MPNYDEAKTPADTPPPIKPATEPKPSTEPTAAGDGKDAVIRGNAERSEAEAERAMSAAQDDGDNGKGEGALDSPHPETALPPN